MSLAAVVTERIEARGPMPFEEFMAACLYDPAFGFFATGPLRSAKSGDFLTSPEVSPAFGETLARYVGAERDRVGADGFAIVELGAGSGSLIAPLLAALPAPPPDVVFVEASPAARSALVERFPRATVLDAIDDVPAGLRGVVLANELLDNVPVRLAVRVGDGWEERAVGLGGDGSLGLVGVPARPDTVEWAEAYGGVVPDGGLIEVQLQAGALVSDVLSRLDAGSFVAIDYGGTAEELEPRRTRGTLRTYRAHHLGPDPLLEPGTTDVTVDVNFTAMEAVAAAAGARARVWRQDDFLTAHGLRDHIRSLREQELALARDPAQTMDRLRVRSERTDAETLLHPRGLGDFRVLVMQVR